MFSHSVYGRPKMTAIVLALGEGGDFNKIIHTKHILQIYEKASYKARTRQFLVGAVNGRLDHFFIRDLFHLHFKINQYTEDVHLRFHLNDLVLEYIFSF